MRGLISGAVSFRRVALAGCMLVGLVGCGTGGYPPELKNLAPVQGKLTFQGEPVPGAVLMFHPADEADHKRPGFTSALVDPDGNFLAKTSLSRFLAPGAAPGEYRVTVSWPTPVRSDSDNDWKEQLPAKYQDPKSSGLVVTVEPGMNDLAEIELTR